LDENAAEQGLSSRIYDELKCAILELRIQPGSFLLERSIAEETGVSRTPVREALKRLAQDGWIIWRERRRAVVRGVDMEDVRDIFALRAMIEPFVLSSVCARRESRHLAGKLASVMNRMQQTSRDVVAFMKEDMIFHSILVASLGNERLCGIWRNIAEASMRIAIYALHERRRIEDVLREHGRIVDALWEQDCGPVLERLKEHHESTFHAYEEKFLLEAGSQHAASTPSSLFARRGERNMSSLAFQRGKEHP
jgi:DNA-binding GntR family transcriptional regulator